MVHPTDHHIRCTVEQRCTAAQMLWYAINVLNSECNTKVEVWFDSLGIDRVRYLCRSPYTVEAFYDARTFVDEYAGKEKYADLETEFAPVFLKTCLSNHTMNVNRQWKLYLARYIDKEMGK